MNDNRTLLDNEAVLESGQGSVVVPQPTPQFGPTIEDPNDNLNLDDLFNDEPSTSSSQNELGKYNPFF